ncbi:MAG: SH3 domain-containing protein, partial [Chloroflexi bacterium]
TIHSSIDLNLNQPTGYADLLLDHASLWAATPWGTVMHIDPRTNHVQATIDLSVPLTGLLSGGGSVWALSQQTGTLFRIDPASHAVAAQIPTGSRLQPTVIPSPTPRVVIWKPCPDAATSRLKVGDLAYVTKDPPVPNRVRKEPNRQAEILGLINPGGSMQILEGPTCADGWVWWKVKNADLEGWMAEGDHETYWMVPLYK